MAGRREGEQYGRLEAKTGPKADCRLRYGPPGLSLKALPVPNLPLHHQSFPSQGLEHFPRALLGATPRSPDALV